MSETHILVEKNGIQDQMNKTVWEAIGGSSNTDGWKLVPQAPVEVVEMKQKKSEAKTVEETPVIIDPVGEKKVEAPVEVKSKTSKKK